MKLTKSQNEILESAKKDIDLARECKTLKEFYDKRNRSQSFEECSKYYLEIIKQTYEENKKSIVITSHVNSKTLVKLQDLGLIEIIEDGKNNRHGIDTIKILNY